MGNSFLPQYRKASIASFFETPPSQFVTSSPFCCGNTPDTPSAGVRGSKNECSVGKKVGSDAGQCRGASARPRLFNRLGRHSASLRRGLRWSAAKRPAKRQSPLRISVLHFSVVWQNALFS